MREVSEAPRPMQGVGRVMTMVLEGEIDATEMNDIGEMLFRLSMDGVHRLVIDFAGVTHFDFRGVKPLLRRADVFRELGGDIKLAGLSPYVFAIFRSAGGHQAFDYFSSKAEALASFERPSLGKRE